MKKLFALICATLLAFSVTACGGSDEPSVSSTAITTTKPTQIPTQTLSPTQTQVPTQTPTLPPTPTPEPELSAYKQAKQEILDLIDVGYSGLTPAGAPMYFLASSDGKYVALILENTDGKRYIKFVGSAVIDDDSGILTVTDDEKGYTFGFSAEKQQDGSFYLDCGDLGTAYLEADDPGNVVDYIFMTFNNKEDYTDELIDAMSMLSILDYVDIAFLGVTDTDDTMYYLANYDGSFAALIIESADETSYIQFVGTTFVDANGIQTVTDSEKGYTFSFIAEDYGDGSYLLDCGDLGECYIEPYEPANVVDYMYIAFQNMEDITDEFMAAYGH